MAKRTKEYWVAYRKKYYQDHREHLKKSHADYYRRHRKEVLQRNKKQRESYPGGWNVFHRMRTREQRRILLEEMGGKCSSCGYADRRAIQIDHVHGGGSKERTERRRSGRAQYSVREVRESWRKKEGKYRLLCANCNCIERQNHYNRKRGE